jgi:U3 small nucleolar RNA-associated protein 13
MSYWTIKQTKHQHIKLERAGELALYLDEIIDAKFLSDTQVVLCSNSETIKVVDLETNNCQVVRGHTDIVVCLDVFTYEGVKYVVSGGKDNTIRLWKVEETVTCLAVLKGHAESVTSVSVAAKKNKFFVSAG